MEEDRTQIDLMLGDIVTDARGGLQAFVVVERLAGTASDYSDIDRFDPINIQHGVDESDAVFRCVELPDVVNLDRLRTPTEDYLLPESVLVRYPVESAVDDMEVPLPAHIIASFLLSLTETPLGEEAYYAVFDAIEQQREFDGELITDAVRSLLEVSTEH